MQRRNLLFVSALALVGLLVGCSSGSSAGTLLTNLPTAAQLRAVPLSLGVSGKTLMGETYVWRDLMPSIVNPGEPAPKRGIIVSCTVKATGSAAVPAGLRAEKITITNGEEVWASTEVEARSDEGSFGGIVRNGPEWPVGSSLDVVVTFRDSTAGSYELRAVGQVVGGAY